MVKKIFISYRRDDAKADARDLHNRLCRAFGSKNVFMDVDNLLVGQRFDEQLDGALEQCDVLLALIGPRWTELLNERTGPDERDYVCEEIAAALKRRIAVIPVLVDGAALPAPSSLPDDIKDLTFYQKHDITHERFGRDVDDLVAGIKAVRKTSASSAPSSSALGKVIAALLLLGVIGAGGYAAYVSGHFTGSQSSAPAPVKPEVVTEEMIKEAQSLLKELGYNPGDIDGKRGVETTDAIKAFQRDMGTSSRAIFGQVDQRLISALRVAKRTKLREQRQRDRAEAEAKRKAEEEAQKKAKAEAKRKANEAAAAEKKRKAEEEAKKRADAEAKRKAEAEAARKRDPARSVKPGSGESFKDCDTCPEMVVVPAGSFMMGSRANEKSRDKEEGPQRKVTIDKPFAVGKFEVTWDEWHACVADGGCYSGPVEEAGGDNGWGKGRRPAIEVNWKDGKAYAAWLSKKTGKPYRLLTEAEWEYAARAGTTTRFSWGNSIDCSRAMYGYGDLKSSDCYHKFGNKYRGTLPVGSYDANDWGLHDIHGNVWEWTEDCWNASYKGAPTDGSAWTSGECGLRVLRGGSWGNYDQVLRSASRVREPPGVRTDAVGFRIARTIAP